MDQFTATRLYVEAWVGHRLHLDGGDGNLGWIIRTLVGATIAVGLTAAVMAATDTHKNLLPGYGE